jgi:hypothetical protein
LPKSLRADFEPHSIQAILKSADVFEQQCATQMTGCAMQARFLKSVIQKYQSLKSQATERNKGAHPSISHSTHSTPPVPPSSVPPNTDHDSNQGSISRHEATIHHDLRRQLAPHSQDILGTNLFADNDLWDNLFSDVGFWMNDGTSLSETPNNF